MKSILTDALRYWEPRRIFYNAILAATVIGWVALTWPAFRIPHVLALLALLAVLTMLANLCYCAAYAVDIPMQYSNFQETWRRWRWLVWSCGTIFAVILANYWIADEVYPFLH